MPLFRIALANLAPGPTREDALRRALDAIREAAEEGAQVVCFPECYLPGYRIGSEAEPVDLNWLDKAWALVDQAAGTHRIAVVLGTERQVDEGLRITARVSGPDGNLIGFQDKVQLDPSEEATYRPGSGRRVFRVGSLMFGVVICHEGWRYPETVRALARAGAQVVFHPHTELAEPDLVRQTQFADPANSFHEKAALCRAAENTIYFATVNAALPVGTTTSAVIDPEGRLVAHQPYGESGLLIASIDLDTATGLLARRLRPDGLAIESTGSNAVPAGFE